MQLDATYSWEDGSESIIIRIPLKGTLPAKVDIFLTTVLVKVYFPPYLLLLDVAIGKELDPYNPNNSATIIDGDLNLVFHKGGNCCYRWTELAIPFEDQRSYKVEKRRNESIEKKTAQESNLMERRRDRCLQEERRLLQSQMALDAARCQKISDIQDAEKEKAEKDIYDMLAKVKQQRQDVMLNSSVRASAQKNDHGKTGDKKIGEASRTEVVITSNAHRPQQQFKKTKQANRMAAAKELEPQFGHLGKCDDEKDKELDDEQQHSELEAALRVEDDVDYIAKKKGNNTVMRQPIKNERGGHNSSNIPAPRKSAFIEVEFTSWLFPTPLRESKIQDEEDWIIKNRDHLSSNAVLNEYHKKNGCGYNTAATTTSPAWLKSKGDDFFRSGDYQSAINAYSALLKATNGKDIAALSNRAASLLKLGLWKEVVNDCTKALCLMDGERRDSKSCSSSSVEEDKKMQRLFLRRGAALGRQGLFQLALDDYRSALTYCPDNEEIAQDIEHMGTLVLCNKYKQQADHLVENCSFQEAIAFYGQVLDTIPSHAACLSNRAACFLALGQTLKCIDVCTTALKIMQQYQNRKSPPQQIESLSLLVPSIYSSKGRRWAASTLTRRAVALSRLGNVKQAICDVKEAMHFAPEDEALKSDMLRFESIIQLQE